MIAFLHRILTIETTCRDSHELVQYDELQAKLHDITKGLDGMGNGVDVEPDEYDLYEIKTYDYDVDIDEVEHHSPLPDAGFDFQQLEETLDVGA